MKDRYKVLALYQQAAAIPVKALELPNGVWVAKVKDTQTGRTAVGKGYTSQAAIDSAIEEFKKARKE